MAVRGEMAYVKWTSWVSLSTEAIALAPTRPILLYVRLRSVRRIACQKCQCGG